MSEFRYKREELQDMMKKNEKSILPKRDGVIRDVEPEDPDFFDYTWDAIASVPEGAVRAIENGSDFLERNLFSLGYIQLKNDKGQFDLGYITPSEVTDSITDQRMLPTIYTPETGLGEFTAGVSQFLTGFIGPQKYLKGLGLGGSILKSGARGMTAGAVADLLVWDPNEQRLADLMVQYDSPLLNNSITQFLQSKEGDSRLEARVKNVLEGAFLGSAAELLIALKGIKRLRKIKDIEEKEKVSQEIGESIKEAADERIQTEKEELQQAIERKVSELQAASKAGNKELVDTLSSEVEALTNLMRKDINADAQMKRTEVSKLKRDNKKTAKQASDEAESRYIIRRNAVSKKYEVITKDSEEVVHVGKTKKESTTIANAYNVQEGYKRINYNPNTDKNFIGPKPPKKKDISEPNKKVVKNLTEDNKAINTEELLKEYNIDPKNPAESFTNIIKKAVNPENIKTVQEAQHAIDLIVKSFGKRHKEILGDGKVKVAVAKELGELLATDYNVLLRALDDSSKNALNNIFIYMATKSVIQGLTDNLKLILKEHDVKYLKGKNFLQRQKLLLGDNQPEGYKESREKVLKATHLLNSLISREREIASRFGLGLRMVQEDMPSPKSMIEELSQDTIEVYNTMNSYLNDPDAIAIAARNLSKPKDLVEAVRKSKYRRALEASQSLFINNLLTQLATHTVNLTGNAYEAFFKPFAVMIGGSTGATYHALRGNTEMQKEYMKAVQLGFARWRGMGLVSKELWAMVGRAFMSADPVLDSKLRTQDNLTIKNGRQISPISGEAFYMEDGPAKTAIDWIGKFVEFPGRMLVTGDEIFKQLNYRGKVYSNAMENTMNRGLDVDSKEGMANIKKIVDNQFDANGRANTSPEDGLFKAEYENALEYSRETTFQQELANNENFINFGESIEKFANAHPTLRFVMPFIRTPTNLWRNFETHIPGLGLQAKTMQRLAASGPQGQSDVIGRQILGTSAVITAWNFMDEGIVIEPGQPPVPRMTGRGPKDYQTKKLWYATGWQPYSFLVKNSDGKYVYRQYNRMDPRFYAFGLIADLKEAGKLYPDATLIEQAGNIMVSLMINMGDKSYTRGIGDVLRLMNEADRTNEKQLDKFFGKFAGNFMPYSNFIKSFQTDSKELRNFEDKFYDSLTYGFGEAEDKLDLFGEPINKKLNTMYMNPSYVSFITQGPFLLGRESEVAQDKDDVWLYKLKHLTYVGNLRLVPPSIKYNGLDLTEYEFKPGRRKRKGDPKEGTTALYYWRSQMGKIKIDGLTLRESIRELVESREFDKLAVGIKTAAGEKMGAAEQEIWDIYDEFKTEAKELMFEKYPQILKDDDEIKNLNDMQQGYKDFQTRQQDRKKKQELKQPERGDVIDKLLNM